MENSFRIKLALFGFLIVIILILARLFYWQVIVSERFAVEAARQHFDLQPILAQRGQILANDGFPLVSNEQAFLLFGLPTKFKESPESLTNKLSQILVKYESNLDDIDQKIRIEMEKKRLLEKLQNTKSAWVAIEHRVSRQAKEEIESLRIEGLGFEEEESRTYPEGTASAHLLGFLGYDSEGLEKGYFGLEGFYDLELRGHPGLVKREKDATGKPILIGASYEEEKRDGRNIITTIDRTAQFIIEKNLKKGLERYGASNGTVILMDPNNGAILAMISLPTYNPVVYSEYKQDIFSNPAISVSYEPGSTFKVLIMSAAINEGVISPETKCTDCDGPRIINGYTINTWNNKYFPDTTATDTLIHSDNIGMIFVGEKLGREKLYDYLSKFGFGNLTGIDLQGEDSPSLRAKADWKEIDLATASFGQGIAVTPIQMIKAVAAVANGGKLVKPYIVKSISDQGKSNTIENKPEKNIIKPSTAKVITQMMVEAVDKGEAKWAKPAGFKIAGKTGTAQIPVAGHYDTQKTIASFIGFAPADNPRFIMLVTLREPITSPWGSETAAPLWFEIAKELFTYYGILPG